MHSFITTLLYALQTKMPGDPGTLEGLEQIQIELFDKIMASPAVRTMFAVMILAVIAIIVLALYVVKTNSANVSSQDGQAFKLIDMAGTKSDRLEDAMLKLKESVEAKVGAGIENYEESFLVIQTYLERLEQVVSSAGSAEDVKEHIATALAQLLLEAVSLHQTTRTVVHDEINESVADYLQTIVEGRTVEAVGVTFRFPPDDDCRWRLVRLVANNKERAIKSYDRPMIHDNTPRPESDLKHGDIVKAIETSIIAGWIAVIKNPEKAPNDWERIWVIDLGFKLEPLSIK